MTTDVWKKPSRKVLDKAIDKFLAEYRKSDGGYAHLGEKDMELLHDVMNKLVASKCECDPDGDRPISYSIVDRNYHLSANHFLPVRYPYDTNDRKVSEDDLDRMLQTAQSNMTIAMSDLQSILRELKYRREDKKKNV